MDQSQVPNEKTDEKPKGCGCGNANTKISYADNSQITEKQEKLINRIKKASQRKNSIYKTNTRYFI
jgi:hypothetical protein